MTPNITRTGTVADLDGRSVDVGTDYEAVTVAARRFSPRQLAVLLSLIADARVVARRCGAGLDPASRIQDVPAVDRPKYPGTCDFDAAGSQDIFKIRVVLDDRSPDPDLPYRWRAADGTTGHAATREAAAATADGYDAGRAAAAPAVPPADPAYTARFTAAQVFSFADLVRRLSRADGPDTSRALRQDVVDALQAFADLLPEPSDADGDAYLAAIRDGALPNWAADGQPLTETAEVTVP